MAQARDLVKRNVALLCDVPRGTAGRPSKSLTLAQAADLLTAAKKPPTSTPTSWSRCSQAHEQRSWGADLEPYGPRRDRLACSYGDPRSAASALLAEGRHRQLGGSVGARRSSSGRYWTCRAVAPLLYFTAVRDHCGFRFGCQTALFAECPHAILRLVQPHIPDLSTSNSAPGEDGSKPCSISQRAATRLRHDHHARITSRSTSVP